MKNRQQLVNRAIKELGIIPLSTSNFASIDELVDGVVTSLERRRIVYIAIPTTVTASINEEHFLPLAQCVAYAAAPEMDVDPKIFARLAAQCEKAEADMKDMDRKDDPERHYFTMLHDYYPTPSWLDRRNWTNGTF